MPKVSIIVPVYNVEKYLRQCLDSVLAQTLKEIEIICVDDGSTDGSAEILDMYAQQDTRVKVIHKKNSGYGDSMNVGLEHANGRYIGIVESDDTIKENMYEVLYAKAEENALDFIKSNVLYWWESIGMKRNSYNPVMAEWYDKILTEDERSLMYRFVMNTWTGIYRKSFLDKYRIRHNATPGAAYQDNGFWIQTLSFCKRAMWLSDAFYYYRQDNPMASIKSKDKMLTMRTEYTYVYDVIKDRVSELELEKCLYYRMYREYRTFYRISDALKHEYSKILVEDYQKYSKYIEGNQRLSNWFQEMTLDAKSFCDRFIGYEQKVLGPIEQAKQIVLYGAGVRAKKLLPYLYNLNVYSRISHVIVTNKGEEEYLENIPIVEMDNFLDYNEDTLFLVTTYEGYDIYPEMVRTLENKGITNYMGCSDIMELVYSVCIR